MTWTDAPGEDGFYWMRSYMHGNITYTLVCADYTSTSDGVYIRFVDGNVSVNVNEHPGAKFFGPLTPPEYP